MKLKTIIGIIILAMSVHGLNAQSYDEQRMDRDLKIAENILSTLMTGDSRLRYHSSIESNYMEGYGVIFSVPRISYIYTTKGANVVYGSARGYVVATVDGQDGSDEEEVALSEARRAEKDREEKAKEAAEELKEQLTIFLVDYADLIGQLKASDRIVVQSGGGGSNGLFYSGQNRSSKQSTFSAQVLKGDLMAYKQGKMDRDDIIGKITFKTPEEDKEIAKDLELFSTIFARLYEPDLSSTYYISSRSLGYTNLEGFGVTFNMKVYSSSSDNGLHTIRTTGESGLSQEQRDEKVNAMYPEFEKSLKENLMDYGRTIKSLKSDENLVLKVALTECRGCDMPKEIEATVKGKTLQSYDKGSISRADAVKQITIKRKDR